MQKRKFKVQPQEKHRILTLDVLLLHVYLNDLLLIGQVKTRNYKQIRKISSIDEV